ncbi:MAG: MBL fold metallo-hydrolase [Hamadaea sp.]|uniref:MBL fold metallo-hydrolase n=1 Tax=Hamadaea sp. NPDC050747 TaxID=3155789 RepID=UPI001852BDA8|nr:MBL fold metallo-hydrolase [Hamadaea sp.]NUR70077.1 MBL fold metallo-hydrolase [Hamadaea sp.]NUT03498.1 MBL fold metallo-hydrolase [Hamadaea sp.]
MQLIKFTHACVRLHDGDRTLLIDPGVWSEPEVFEGVTDVLITHEHFDHVDAERLTQQDVRVFAPELIAGELREKMGEAVTTVATGDTFTAAGFDVTVVGGRHAEIYEGLPGCANVGYLVGTSSGALYHPGDALFVPEAEVGVLLVPASAPWLKLREALDFVRAVAPKRAHPIHDRMLSEDIGFAGFDRWMDLKGQTAYSRIPIGGGVDL